MGYLDFKFEATSFTVSVLSDMKSVAQPLSMSKMITSLFICNICFFPELLASHLVPFTSKISLYESYFFN